jgi:predicted Co/Zn/Cd cation transporter (cation efflux family)
MEERKHPYQRRSLTAMDGALALIAILLIVQMWLLTASLEAFLAGHRETALPAAVASALLFVACLAFYVFVDRIDRESQKP